MKEVLLQLCEKLGEKDELNAVREQFGKYIVQGGDTSRQMAKFLQAILKDGSRIGKVLKVKNYFFMVKNSHIFIIIIIYFIYSIFFIFFQQLLFLFLSGNQSKYYCDSLYSIKARLPR
jgi:hypothetical protein